MTGSEIRKDMISAREEYIDIIKAELMGPGSEFSLPDAEHELISSSPTSRYSVGILFPQGNAINQDNDETVPTEETGLESADTSDDVSRVNDPVATKKQRTYEVDETADENLDEEIGMSTQYMPSSMGITFLVKGNADLIRGSLSFATYRNAKVPDCAIPYLPDDPDNYAVPSELAHVIVYDKESKVLRLTASLTAKEVRSIFERDTIPESEAQILQKIAYRFVDYCSMGYVRIPHKIPEFVLDFTNGDYADNEENHNLDGTDAKLVALRRRISDDTWSVTVMLVNGLTESPVKSDRCIFQSKIEIGTDNNSFVFLESNPNSDVSAMDDEERSLDLLYREPYRAKCDSVTLERKISDFVPDIIVSVRGKICLIEIAVTHFVDEEKQRKIESVGLPMVEVDLSSLHGQSLSREVIRDVLVNQTDGKTWVYNPLRKEALAWAASEYQRRYDALVEAEEKKLAERKRKAEQSKQKRTEATTVVEELMHPENNKKALLELRSDKAFNAVLSNLSFRRDISDQLPFFVDIPITGEMVFACDRRVWQSAIFDKFIYNRAEGNDGYTRYSNDKIHGCVKKYMPFVPINWKLAYGVNVNLGNGWRKLTMLYDVIEKYIEYLIYIGFLEKVDYRAGIVTRTHSLIPPNETEAKLLENAIKRCDCYSPLIDDEIEATLHPSEVSSGSYNYTWGGEFDAQDHSSRDPILRGIENRQGAEREIGYGDAQRHDFESEEPFYDCFGKRWVVCKCCGQIKREDEMKSYGGRGSENKGICNECSGW